MRILATFALLCATACDALIAQQPPYDAPPRAEPPYYRVRYEASSASGELIYPVSYTIWVPPGVATLRGVIVHQHGCGEGSCRSGQTGAFDLHWQALARKHDCALLSPAYEQPEGTDCQMWCDPRNGSDEAFQKSLVELGSQSGYAELATVPWALWGHSGGGHWAGGMTLLYPDRVAAAWLRSGVPLFETIEGRSIEPYSVPRAALSVPIMCNLGTKEGFTLRDGRFAGVWPANETFFNRLRSFDSPIAVAVDPLTSHECGNQRYLAIPWFDACLLARLPEKQGDPLQVIPSRAAWLAPLPAAGAEVIPPVRATEFMGERSRSIWLPSQSIAIAWTQYVTDTAVSDTSPPPAPTRVQLVGNTLTWEAEADLESGISHFIIESHGKSLATVPAMPRNPFGRPLFQGLQYSDTPQAPLTPMRYRLEPTDVGQAGPYVVRTVNTVGLISE
jgi:pimeloyl-ACP methyl ester carboxylesterase